MDFFYEFNLKVSKQFAGTFTVFKEKLVFLLLLVCEYLVCTL